MNARDIALDILNDCEERQIYVQIALNNHRSMKQLEDARDRAFVYQLVYGVLQQRLYLDYALDALVKKGVQRLDTLIRNILRLAAYQVLFLDRVPAHAAVNEAVKQAKKRRRHYLSGFINGVLRNLVRNSRVVLPDEERHPVKHLSVKYSHPQWMVSRWLKRWGRETAELILAANNIPIEVTLRVNTLKANVKECVAALLQDGVEVSPGQLLPNLALRIKKSADLNTLRAFRRGMVTVQDEASMYAAHLLGPQAGERVLDMCSAPGGKTTQMSAMMNNQGQIVAVDVHEHRLKLVVDNARRLGATNITTLCADATVLGKSQIGMFDKILCDAPCSGLGTIRSKPEIKWYKQERDIASLAQLQEKLLRAAADLLKPGGRLVYSTCTNEPEETDKVVRQAIAGRSGLRLKSQDHLLPHKFDTDGFFVAVLEKEE